MKKLILFGDSNTYGYDPRDFFTGRYPEEIRWTTAVKNALADEYEVIEEGQNGRYLPLASSPFFQNLVNSLDADDTMIMMLGTNDILLTDDPDAGMPVQRMKEILSFAKDNCRGRFIVIAPPYVSDAFPDLKEYHECCVKMNSGFMALANEYGITLFDAASWGIPLSSDGVHFSAEGHRKFAEEFLKCFK